MIDARSDTAAKRDIAIGRHAISVRFFKWLPIACTLMTSHILLALDRPPVEMALIIGNNGHRTTPTRQLKYADDDAIRFALSLRSLHPKAVLSLLLTPDDPETVSRLGDLELAYRPPTMEDLALASGELKGMVDRIRRTLPGTVVHLFFYFSGHGERDGSLHLQDSYLSPTQRWQLLESVGADRVFALLDGCYLGNDRGGEETAPTLELFAADDLRAGSRPLYAGSIGAITPVPELEHLRGGLLTLVALNGLMGLADLDRDRRITFLEWGQYVQEEVERQPGAPTIRVLKPERDPLATVVDLRQTLPVGLVLERDFPTGLVQVTRAGTRELVAQVHHQIRHRDELHLPPGRYDVVRFLMSNESVPAGKVNDLRAQRVYPASRVTIDVTRLYRTIVDSQTELEAVFLLPASLRGAGVDGLESLIAKTPLIPLSEEDERFLSRVSLESPSRAAGLAVPHWRLELSLDAPFSGVHFSAPPAEGVLLKENSANVLNPWLSTGVSGSRLYPVGLRSRMLLVAGPVLGWHLSRLFNVYGCQSVTDEECVYDESLRHQIKLGVRGGLHWLGPRGAVSIEPEIAWAPSLLTTQDMTLVVDWPHDQTVPFVAWRYVLPQTAVAGVSTALRLPLAKGISLGPLVTYELELFNKLNPGHIMWRVSAGLELRQRTLSR